MSNITIDGKDAYLLERALSTLCSEIAHVEFTYRYRDDVDKSIFTRLGELGMEIVDLQHRIANQLDEDDQKIRQQLLQGF